MKKSLTFVTLAVVLGASAQAQFNKGDRFFGGTFSANVGSYSGGPNQQVTSNVGFAPSYSWFTSNNLALGIRGGLQYNYVKSDNNLMYAKDQTFGVAPGVSLTKYKTIKDKFGVYFAHDVTLGFNWRTSTTSTGSKVKSNYKSAYYSFSPGVFYRFTENFLGQANVGGLYGGWSGANGDDAYVAGISFLQSFNLGIAYRIGKRS